MPEPTFDPPNAIAYGVLGQCHPDYDGDRLQEIEDLYVGGYQILKRAHSYLFQLVNEHGKRYEERCKTSSYQPYFGQIVDQFTSDVFGQPLSIKPAADADNPNTPGKLPDQEFYSSFEKDADSCGHSFADVLTGVLRTALKQRCALVLVDAPKPGDTPEPINRADEEKSGAGRIYSAEHPIEQLVDWKCDDRGEFLWAILCKVERDRESPLGSRSDVTETYTIWYCGSETAEWVTYAITYDPKKKPDDTDPVPRKDQGKTSFKRIPLLRFELPEGLWIGNKIGPQAREHWQRRSALLSAENKSLAAIPTLKKGPEAPAVGGAIPAEITQTPSRGNRPMARFNDEGWVELGAQDSLEFAEPSGHCYEIVDRQLGELRDAMFAVNHQMAASIRPTGAALGRSGLSKQKDEDATSRVLRALGHMVREFAVSIYDLIAETRGEDVHWTAHGLDAYDSENREDLLSEAVALDEIASAIPSETFHMAHARAIAEKLLKGSVDVETLATIIDELKDGIKAKHELEKLELEAKKDAILNPPDPTVKAPMKPGVKAPMAKAPAQPRPGA